MTYIEEITEYKKGRSKVLLEDGTVWILYRGEIRSYHLRAGAEISDELYREIQTEVIGKRAKKRAMHLLEKMDRTEAGLREKLRQNEYPPEAVDAAIEYVKSYHYLDDMRYARNFVRCYRNSRSQKRMRMDLLSRGISSSLIEQALEEEYEGEETQLIYQLLQKRGYDRNTADRKEQQRTYAFLMRKGFRSEDILRAMKCSEYLT